MQLNQHIYFIPSLLGLALLAMGCSLPFRAVDTVTKTVTQTTVGVAKAGAHLAGQGVSAAGSAASSGLPAAALFGLHPEMPEPPLEP
jgi:hypothetical protein